MKHNNKSTNQETSKNTYILSLFAIITVLFITCSIVTTSITAKVPAKPLPAQNKSLILSDQKFSVEWSSFPPTSSQWFQISSLGL